MPKQGSAEAINITLDSSGTSWSSDGVRWKGKRYDWHSTKTAKPVASNEIWERLQKPINKQVREKRTCMSVLHRVPTHHS